MNERSICMQTNFLSLLLLVLKDEIGEHLCRSMCVSQSSIPLLKVYIHQYPTIPLNLVMCFNSLLHKTRLSNSDMERGRQSARTGGIDVSLRSELCLEEIIFVTCVSQSSGINSTLKGIYEFTSLSIPFILLCILTAAPQDCPTPTKLRRGTWQTIC